MTMRRDLVGYGFNPPALVWPGGAKVAVSLAVNYEEGAELSLEAGDAENERVGEVLSVVPPGRRDMGMEHVFAYGLRAGLPRFLDAFDRAGLPATFWMCGRAVERTPDLAAEVVRRGHEAGCHGWLWRPNADYTTIEEERAAILRATDAIETATGERPVGYFCRGSPSPNTRRLLQDLGYTYDSNALDDDLPYRCRDTGMLVLPYALDSNDMKFFHPNGFVQPLDFSTYVAAALDQLIEEGRRGTPRMLNIGFHLRICGRPARFRAVEAILADLKRRGPDVWVATRRQIAASAATQLPPPVRDVQR
jgi:peptidoglycan/xylan/chitin deacetylase (PgdA/CDA1 family)